MNFDNIGGLSLNLFNVVNAAVIFFYGLVDFFLFLSWENNIIDVYITSAGAVMMYLEIFGSDLVNEHVPAMKSWVGRALLNFFVAFLAIGDFEDNKRDWPLVAGITLLIGSIICVILKFMEHEMSIPLMSNLKGGKIDFNEVDDDVGNPIVNPEGGYQNL